MNNLPMDSTSGVRFSLEDSTILIPRDRRLRKLYLELSSRCNLSCPMCFRLFWKDGEGDLDWSVYENLLQSVGDFPHLETFHFAGLGEPLVHPRFLDAVRCAKARGLRVSLTTNGTLVTREMARELVALGVDAVDISFEAEQALLPGRETLAAAHLETFHMFREEKKRAKRLLPELRAAFVLTRSNVDNAADIPATLSSVGVTVLSMSNLVPLTKELTELVLYPLSLEEEARLHRKIFVACQRAGVTALLPRFALSSEKHCNFVRSESAVIRSDGAVVPCYRLAHTYPEWVLGREKTVVAASFGSLKERSLPAIWDDERYVSFRWRLRRALYASCLDCHLLPVCEYPKTTESDCWGDSPACSDCLWDRNLVRCP